MKEGALLVLLVATLYCSCVGASLNNVQGHKDIVDSLEIIYLENDALHLTWNLLNPTGAVRGFILTWNDGESDKHAQESRTEATIDYPSNLDCSDELTVTVIPLNDDNIHIGTKLTEKFVLQDVITNIVLTSEEKMISASWSIKCPSQVHTETVVIWEGVSHSREFSCRYPSTVKDTTDAACTGGEQVLQPCQSYNVFIEPIDSESSFTGIAGKRRANTLDEELRSKLGDIKLKETKPRSVTLLWKGPNPECHGTNYVVTYTETRLEDGRTSNGEAKVVKGSKLGNQIEDQLITANLHPSDNSKVMGHVNNLQPFTQYEFCVAAGNTEEDLVCQGAQTLEERLDPPSHLSLTTGQQASTTIIDVMWKEPSNMNGIFANYIIRWYWDSKHADSLNTTQHSCTIVDAKPCVDYIIEVTAVNGAGEGVAARTEGVADNGDCHRTTCSPSTTASSVEHDALREPAKDDSVLTGLSEIHVDIEHNNWRTAHTIIAAVGVLAVVAILAISVFLLYVMLQPTEYHSPADSKNRALESSSSLDTPVSVSENSDSGPFLNSTGSPN